MRCTPTLVVSIIARRALRKPTPPGDRAEQEVTMVSNKSRIQAEDERSLRDGTLSAMPDDPFYTSLQWRVFRRAFLRRHPGCVISGCPTPATHVDHKRTRRSGGAPFDPENCQSLCQSHHSAKTARLDQPSRRASHKPLRAIGCDAHGLPLAPEHPWHGAKPIGRR